MKILVLLKETPDTEAKFELPASGTATLDLSSQKFVISPYDEFAVEEALRIKDKEPATEVVVASFASSKSREVFVKALAMGADRGILVPSDNVGPVDSLGVATVLAALVRKEKPDLVLAGKQGIDQDNMSVAVMTAELLGWPHVNVAIKTTFQGGQVSVEREVEGGTVEVFDVTLPAVIGAHKALNNPRIASIPNIMKAKKKPFDELPLGDLSLTTEALREVSLTKVVSYRPPAAKPAGKVFRDEPVDVMVDKLVKALREEAKAI